MRFYCAAWFSLSFSLSLPSYRSRFRYSFVSSLSFSLLRWRDLESPPFGFVLARLLGLLLPSGVVSSSAPLSVLGMPPGTGCNRARVSVARECMRAPLHRHRAVGAPCAESSPLPPPLLSCTWQWLTNPCVGVSVCVCSVTCKVGEGESGMGSGTHVEEKRLATPWSSLAPPKTSLPV